MLLDLSLHCWMLIYAHRDMHTVPHGLARSKALTKLLLACQAHQANILGKASPHHLLQSTIDRYLGYLTSFNTYEMTSYSFGHVPVLLWASSPTYESIPTITPWLQERPTMEGNTARGASSPAKPALHTPEPLSTTSVTLFSSHILTSHTKSKTTHESKLKETCRYMNQAWEEPSVYEIYTSGCRNS